MPQKPTEHEEGSVRIQSSPWNATVTLFICKLDCMLQSSNRTRVRATFTPSGHELTGYLRDFLEFITGHRKHFCTIRSTAGTLTESLLIGAMLGIASHTRACT